MRPWSGYGWRCPCGGAVRPEATPIRDCDRCGPWDSSTWRMVRIDVNPLAEQDALWLYCHALAESAEPRRGHFCPICRHEIRFGWGIDPRSVVRGHHAECPRTSELPEWVESFDGPLIEARRIVAFGLDAD